MTWNCLFTFFSHLLVGYRERNCTLQHIGSSRCLCASCGRGASLFGLHPSAFLFLFRDLSRFFAVPRYSASETTLELLCELLLLSLCRLDLPRGGHLLRTGNTSFVPCPSCSPGHGITPVRRNTVIPYVIPKNTRLCQQHATLFWLVQI
jgi:hypothetical protein